MLRHTLVDEEQRISKAERSVLPVHGDTKVLSVPAFEVKKGPAKSTKVL